MQPVGGLAITIHSVHEHVNDIATTFPFDPLTKSGCNIVITNQVYPRISITRNNYLSNINDLIPLSSSL